MTERKRSIPPSVLDMSFEELEARVAAAPENESEEGAAYPTDAHKLRASELFGVPVEEVTPEQRAYAKRRNHRALYSYGGMRPGDISVFSSGIGTGKSKLKF